VRDDSLRGTRTYRGRRRVSRRLPIESVPSGRRARNFQVGKHIVYETAGKTDPITADSVLWCLHRNGTYGRLGMNVVAFVNCERTRWLGRVWRTEGSRTKDVYYTRNQMGKDPAEDQDKDGQTQYPKDVRTIDDTIQAGDAEDSERRRDVWRAALAFNRP